MADWFQVGNGTRQGCPLAPMLYILTLEPLAAKVRQNRNIKGIRVNDQELKVCMYADDVVVTLTDPETSLVQFMKEVDQYSKLSNYKLNLSKSQALTININEATKRRMANVFPFDWTNQGFTYLGIYLTPDYGHESEDFNTQDSSVPLSVDTEDDHVPEIVQYKTAEIADAMQGTDIPTDPAVLLSMLPREMKDKVFPEAAEPVCDGEACSTPESLIELVKDPSDILDKTNTVESDTSKIEESNNTDSSKPLKVNCEDRNITGMENFTLQILNASQDLMEFLNPNSSECTLVLFYTPWCRFSAGLAPHFNSLPRAFPMLHFLALDASEHSSLSTRFGTVAVPNILLFQGAKPMARFNHSERTLETLKSFIFNQSGIESRSDVDLTDADCEGPLPCAPVGGIDWLLAFSLLYVTIFILYATLQTESIRWLIPGQEHEHQE
ncbi:thioredoxin domain-containing protein 15 [Pelodytes ibericus]